MTPSEKFQRFSALHVKGDPLTLYNIWDAGSARAVAGAGAPALATGSWSVAAAQGYEDGEALPLDFLLRIAARIVASVDVPVSVDFEGCYAEAPESVAANVAQLIDTGAVGMNFEDRIVNGEGLYDINTQAARLTAARGAGGDLFINARTDLFLESDAAEHAGHVEQAIARAQAYADAGANGFFAPGLTDLALIARIVEGSPLPVNVMMTDAAPSLKQLADAGVARVSHGPGPFRKAMAELAERYSALGAN